MDDVRWIEATLLIGASFAFFPDFMIALVELRTKTCEKPSDKILLKDSLMEERRKQTLESEGLPA
jgi:hypothetical protein